MHTTIFLCLGLESLIIHHGIGFDGMAYDSPDIEYYPLPNSSETAIARVVTLNVR